MGQELGPREKPQARGIAWHAWTFRVWAESGMLHEHICAPLRYRRSMRGVLMSRRDCSGTGLVSQRQ
jgi:hypothetical protein